MKTPAWTLAAVATLAVAIMAAGAVSLAAGHFAWGSPETPKAQGEALRVESIVPGVKNPAALKYRERVAEAVVREPQNTWSNLGFVLVGFLIAAHDPRILSRFLGAALVAQGLASGVYHASLLPGCRTFDVAMMGWVAFAFIMMGLNAVAQSLPVARKWLTGQPVKKVWLSTIGGGFAMAAAVFRNDIRISGMKPFDSTYATIAGVTVVFCFCSAASCFPPKLRSYSRIALLATIVAVAIFCQLEDHPGYRLFRPDGLVQAHAVWHLLMALAAALAYDLFATIEGHPPLWRQAA